MKLGQILDVFEKRYSDRALEKFSSSKIVRDREEIICTIWKDVIVPAVARILVHNNETMTEDQKIGLCHYLNFCNHSNSLYTLLNTIGVEKTVETRIKFFYSMIRNYVPYTSYEKEYIGHIVTGNQKISKLHKLYREEKHQELEELLQEPYEKKLKNLMSQLRETVVYDPQILKKLKDIEGIEPYLTEENEKNAPVTSL